MNAPDVDLPPLPEPQEIRAHLAGGEGAGLLIGRAFFADHMQAYALQAVLRERERCAKLADANAAEAWDRSAAREKDMWEHFAAAIRGEKK